MVEIQKAEEILKIINMLKAKEYESGQTEENIIYKYTFGECAKLAQLIKKHYANDADVWIVCFTRIFYDSSSQIRDYSHMRGSFWHVCVGLGELGNDYIPRKDSLIFDINGMRRFEEVDDYLSQVYSGVKSDFYKTTIAIMNYSRDFGSDRNGDSCIQKCYTDFLKSKREFEENGEM